MSQAPVPGPGSSPGSGAGSFGEEGGLTLEQYAELGVALFGKEGADRDAVLRARGLDSAKLDAANTAWMARLRSEPAAAVAYNDAYQRAMVAGGVQRPDVPLETYVQMLRQMSAGTPTADVCAANGMNLEQFSLLSQYWTTQLTANPQLAARFAALMSAGAAMPGMPAIPSATPPPATPPAVGPII
ncbi:MAG TPA: hypothetical protein VNN79_08725 [Actinomycetota bacterium]|nr:hypothetical protein [Actinomycetota bacterium]